MASPSRRYAFASTYPESRKKKLMAKINENKTWPTRPCGGKRSKPKPEGIGRNDEEEW
jgi:hypothetical protein